MLHKTFLLPLLLLLLPGALARADVIVVQNGDFEQPEKASHRAPLQPAGFRVSGKARRFTRFVSAPPHTRAVALGSGATLTLDVRVPAGKVPKKLAPEGWYAVASLDVLGLAADGKATLKLSAVPKGKGRSLGSVSASPTEKAPPGGRSVAKARLVERIWLKLPSRRLAPLAGQTLELRIEVAGRGRVVFDNLRFEHFHDAPTRALVGKPNGKNGPDLLASGALGFTALTEHQGSAFSLLALREGGPALKAGLRPSDLIVAVGGRPLQPSSLAAGLAWFRESHEAALGREIERALKNGEKILSLTVLRDKGTKALRLKLPLSEGFAESFPFEDALAERMREDLIRWIVSNQKPNGGWPGSNAVNASLAGLALLGTRDRTHRKALRRLVAHLLETNPSGPETKGFSYWAIAYQGIFLSEYYLASGDKRALAWVKDAIAWLPSTTHESKRGMPAFGHSPKGLPYDNKALMAPCSHLLVFEALALRCGIGSKVWEHIKPYVLDSWSDPKKGGHGAMGYNHSAQDKAQFWSRTGLTALALKLRGDRPGMQKALTGIMAKRHPWMLNSHAYGEPGAALGLAGLALANPKAFARVMPQWRWRFLNAWQPGFGLRYSSPHMGAPYMGEEAIVNPAYGMLFSVLNKGLVMTGGKAERWLAGRKVR